ncbi:helicase-exonuclease AddAB subunit AddA [Agathobaculum sp.]|uniref:helicase-exonuclease AddAB subunit AddA n=1 Tax=Agathobaculum sp. TaxID=2048138 RepID=UPI002A7FA15D|nr:helicase-exonuclease AddAB subunit AddA [Agathobaculum sp.]MDY3617830.1 helicase-exonuclease AddAB subunit AddA [Agathobaculum sp.]
MPQWTHDQQLAIDSRGSALLVSAAAGSGKTAVLTERVLRRLTDEHEPADIDRLLLVTFTKAAAAEMRERIASAISAALALRPDDKRLRRQLFLVHRAQITTVHAFCQQLAREQAVELGIAPDFRILDEQESLLLRTGVLEDVLEAAYASEDEAFFALSDLLSSGRDDKRLEDTVLRTYEKIQSHPDPRAFLESVRRGLYAGGMDTAHGRVLLRQARAAAEHGAMFLERAAAECESVEELRDAYLPALTNDLRQARALLAALETGDWDTCVDAARAVAPDRLKAVRGFEDKALLEAIKTLREEWKTASKAIREKWLTVKTDEAVYDRALVAPALNALIDTVNAFDDAFSKAKRERNAADFHDLEHFAVRLLIEDGKPSTLARALSENYAEILVDEYQDTNAVQDAIFRALSRDESNLFLVGDVKQSIYGFRLADPSIFLAKYRKFSDVEHAENGRPARVVLGQNFRSRAQVLDACNTVFKAVMGDTVGDMAYTDREALHLGAAYPAADDPRYRAEVLLADAADMGGDDDGEDKTTLEARMCAGRIRRLLDEGLPILDKETGVLRPVTPGDIVILLRSPRIKARAFTAALEAVGLSASAEERGGLLGTSEVGAVVSLLTVIDNPRQDIDLIGVMRSPLFSFSEQELADIRLADRQASYYDALLAAAQDDEKAAAFVETLASLRDFAADQPVYRVLWEIYERTGALGLYGALPNGAQRQQNLLAFFERARAFETQGYRGLFAFVRLLRGMQETGEDFQRVDAALSGGAVRIMSIHKSKGLEFPVVIVADCAKRFNEADLREPVLVHSELGFGSKCRDRTRGIQYDTVERTAVTVQQRREMVSEELRVLYVAMTRAKEKLILTGVSGSLASSLQKWALLASLPELPQYAMGAVRAPLGWIVAPLLRQQCTRELREQYELDVPERLDIPESFEVHVWPAADLSPDAEPMPGHFEELKTGKLVVRPDLDYPNAFLADLPSKLTATGIGRGYRADEAAEMTPPPRKEVPLRAPFFEKRAKRLTPAEIGTAHHLFLQFCDYKAVAAPNGVAQELARLRQAKILSDEQADAVDENKICAFFASDLYLTLLAQGQLRREFKFSVLAPAAQYYPEAASAPEERVLLQGVIDLLAETGQGFIILDFKTDRVRAEEVRQRAERYRAQMDAYAFAVGAVFGKPVQKKVLFFLSCGVWCEI